MQYLVLRDIYNFAAKDDRSMYFCEYIEPVVLWAWLALRVCSYLAIPDCINLRGGVQFMLASGIANLPCYPPFKFQQHQRARKYLLLLISNVNRTLKV